MQTLGEKIVSVPLEIISRATGRKIKTSVAQIKIIKHGANDPLEVLAACEEGMFEAHYTASKLRKSKIKQDLSNETWDSIISFLLNTSLTVETVCPSGYENTLLLGRLTSSEVYDPRSGSLLGDELSDLPPALELSVRTNGPLSVEYGSLDLRYVDTEELSKEERVKVNLLTWIQDSAKQTQIVQQALFENMSLLRNKEELLAEQAKLIEEMESDYKVIVHDLEDRFFQVLQSKKQMIASLQGAVPEDFALLNETYKERQKSNLKILNLEDIIVGEGDWKYATRKARHVKKRKIKVEENEGDDKKEREIIKNDDRGENFSSKLIKSESIESEPEEITFERKMGIVPQKGLAPETSPELGQDSDFGPENAGEFTDYSGSDPGAGHVSEIASGAGSGGSDPGSNDEGNETEYSE